MSFLRLSAEIKPLSCSAPARSEKMVSMPTMP